MKKTIIILVIVGLLAATVYYFTRKKTDAKKGGEGSVLPDFVTPPIVAPAPTQTATGKILSSTEGEGKIQVDLLMSKIGKNESELNEIIYNAGISQADLWTGTNNSIFRDRVTGNGYVLPLYIDTISPILQRGKSLQFQSGIWQNVNNVQSFFTDLAAKTGVQVLVDGSEKDGNKFIDNYPCVLSPCKGNDKKRNQQVMKNGTMLLVVSDTSTFAKNYSEAILKVNAAVKEAAISKLKNAGWQII